MNIVHRGWYKWVYSFGCFCSGRNKVGLEGIAWDQQGQRRWNDASTQNVRWGSQTMLKRGWLSSCKFQDKIVFNSNYRSIWNWSSWIPPSSTPRKSDTVLGTEESCLALATGLWQDETVSKTRNIFYSLVVIIHSQKVWNDISCYHEKEWICEDSEKLLKKMGLAWTFGGQKKMDMHKFVWQGSCSVFIRKDVHHGNFTQSYKCRKLECLTKQKPPHHITGGAWFEDI